LAGYDLDRLVAELLETISMCCLEVLGTVWLEAGIMQSGLPLPGDVLDGLPEHWT
jgi:hypothetical protein